MNQLAIDEVQARITKVSEALGVEAPDRLLDADKGPSDELMRFCAETGLSLDFILLGDENGKHRPAQCADAKTALQTNQPAPVKCRLQLEEDAITLHGLAEALLALTWEDDARDQKHHPSAVPALIRTIEARSMALVTDMEKVHLSEQRQ